jgi:hypothetical protein
LPSRRQIYLGVVAVVVIALVIILGMSRPVGLPRPPDEPTIQLASGEYRVTEVNLPHCQQPIGSSTPNVSAESANFSFSLRIIHCFSPAGLDLNGSATPAGGASYFFTVISNQAPDEEGWIWWFSPDDRAAVRWDGAYGAQVLSRVD